ncbi:hypothetical protein KVV02_007437 [Mortierella alpina]|uniref:Uncharacterized protein n=1 Tax=Mortierella alpina TaxID=64518 RepID=A0A9P8A654_MORAP|nr:hypothetical protein KVV02_007437 [Mortierella alpina]
MIARKHSRTMARRPRHTILSTLLISLSSWAHLASAVLECIPTMSFPSGLLPNQVFTLGFKNDEFAPGSLISAHLMCYSDTDALRSVLTLGGSYAGNQMSPNSPTTSISVFQATKALANCPNNKFNLFYEYESPGRSTAQAECLDTFSLQLASTSSLPMPSHSTSTPTATSSLVPTGTATTPSGHNTPADDHPTSPSIGLIIGASVGVVALIFVILVVLLVWRKRQQAQARIDYLFSDSLVPSSGFKNDKPIYGRSDPNDDPSATHPPAAMDAPVRQPSYRLPYSQPAKDYKYPRGPQEESPPQRQPSHRLPYSQPAKDYKYPRGPQEESPPQRQPSCRPPYSQPSKDHKYPRGPQEESPQPSYRLPYSLPANDYKYPRGPQEESPPQRQPSYRLPYSQPPNDYNYSRGPQEESPQPSYRLPYSLPANDYDYPRGPQGMQ